MAGRRLFRAGRPFAELDACRGGDRRFVGRLRVDQPAAALSRGGAVAAAETGRSGHQDETPGRDARTRRQDETPGRDARTRSQDKRKGPSRGAGGARRLGPQGWTKRFCFARLIVHLLRVKSRIVPSLSKIVPRLSSAARAAIEPVAPCGVGSRVQSFFEGHRVERVSIGPGIHRRCRMPALSLLCRGEAAADGATIVSPTSSAGRSNLRVRTSLDARGRSPWVRSSSRSIVRRSEPGVAPPASSFLGAESAGNRATKSRDRKRPDHKSPKSRKSSDESRIALRIAGVTHQAYGTRKTDGCGALIRDQTSSHDRWTTHR